MTFLFFLTKPVFFCRLQVNFFYSCPDFRNHISSQFYLPEILSPDPSLVTEKSDRICLGTEVPFNSVPEFSILCCLVHGFAKIFFFSLLFSIAIWRSYSRFESAQQNNLDRSINRACDWTQFQEILRISLKSHGWDSKETFLTYVSSRPFVNLTLSGISVFLRWILT